MNGSKLAPEAARIALLDRINYSQSALQKAYDSHKILLEQLNEISDELTMPDKILLEVEEYLEPEYTRATRIENIKLWLTVALGDQSYSSNILYWGYLVRCRVNFRYCTACGEYCVT